MKSKSSTQIAKGAMNYGPKSSPVRNVAGYSQKTSLKKPGNNFSGKVGMPKKSNKVIC